MTADVELLPLPSPQVPFIDCDPSMTDIRRLVRWYEQGATEYARANVSRATAPLQAEIEALRAEVAEWKRVAAAQETEIKVLRAEVERLRADRDSWEQQASDRVADWHAEHLRAERLAKALSAYQAAVNKIDDLIEYSLPMPPETKAALYAVLANLTATLAKELTND